MTDVQRARGVAVEIGASHALISGLRDRRSETELTRVLASIFSSDPRMAADFVRLVVGHAPHRDHVDLSGLPSELVCRSEVTLGEGRADLSFTDPGGSWHVIIEIKLYAGYGSDQIDRYLRSFDASASRSAIAAVTRDVPTYGDDSADGRWAGSVRWAALLPGLRELQPVDHQLAAQWPLFLDVLEKEGSMGFTRSDPDQFRAWAQFPSARGHMIDFVDAVRRPLLASLQHALGESAGPAGARAAFSTRGKIERAVTPRLGKVLVAFRIPAAGPERVTAGVWGWGEPRFIVELPFPRAEADPVARAAVVEMLKKAGFESWRDQHLTRYLPLDDALLESPDLEDRVVRFAADSFAAIVHSGILDLEPAPVPLEEGEEA